jgi:hypothetical protein
MPLAESRWWLIGAKHGLVIRDPNVLDTLPFAKDGFERRFNLGKLADNWKQRTSVSMSFMRINANP